MNNAIITLSFDDARKDTYHVFRDILAPLGLKAVVYVPSGYVECGFNDPLDIGYNGLMLKENLDWIFLNDLFDIGCHGYMHKNDFDDLEKGINKIQEWYPEYVKYGLASPHSEIKRHDVKKNEEDYKKLGYQYVRGGRNFDNFTTIKRSISLLARKTQSPRIFVKCYASSTMKTVNYYLTAVPVHKLTTLSQLQAMVDYCVKTKKWMILEFHGIDKKDSEEYTEPFCWLEDDFVSLCEYIKSLQDEGKLEVKNPIEMFM